jgi:hypothetical protein
MIKGMPEETLESFTDFVQYIEKRCPSDGILFRGQPCDEKLLPRLARFSFRGPILDAEQRMFDDFKRQAFPYLESRPETDWDWLALAQHHGMATRLLDWTLNPLAALSFTVSEPPQDGSKGVVWIFKAREEYYVHTTQGSSPFDGKRTQVFRPKHLSKRIVAQSGWFTVHKYVDDKKQFIPLEINTLYRESLTKLTIPGESFPLMRSSLRRCWVNHSSLFPDLDGLCREIQQNHSIQSDELPF